MLLMLVHFRLEWTSDPPDGAEWASDVVLEQHRALIYQLLQHDTSSYNGIGGCGIFIPTLQRGFL